MQKWLPSLVIKLVILDEGAANCYISLVFIPIKLARGATKYFKYYVRVLRTKKSLGNTASNNAESVNNKLKKMHGIFCQRFIHFERLYKIFLLQCEM